MTLINRDESRHIAIDYYMVGFYASAEYQRSRPKATVRDAAIAARTFAAMTVWGRPFFRDVFFAPMDRIDPTGERLREAFKRMQLLGARPGLDQLPLVKFWSSMMDLYHRPWMGRRAKEMVARVVGAEPRFMQRLATEAELERARTMSLDLLAEEALEAKHA